MKRWLALSTFFLLGFGLAQENIASIKQAALEAATPLLGRDDWNPIIKGTGKKCTPKGRRLYAGEPFFVRSLLHPTQYDLERLQRRIKNIQEKEPEFIPTNVENWLLKYKDAYRVPIFDSICGYLSHTELVTGSKELRTAGRFTPLPRRTAQDLLAAAEPPTFVKLITLTSLYDGYMWVSGSRAIEAFRNHALYRIVNRLGKPVSPLGAKLTPHIFGTPFTLSDGRPSIFWYFQLPVRLEPILTKP